MSHIIFNPAVWLIAYSNKTDLFLCFKINFALYHLHVFSYPYQNTLLSRDSLIVWWKTARAWVTTMQGRTDRVEKLMKRTAGTIFLSFLAVTLPSDEFIAVTLCLISHWTECRSVTWTVLFCRMQFFCPSSPWNKGQKGRDELHTSNTMTAFISVTWP